MQPRAPHGARALLPPNPPASFPRAHARTHAHTLARTYTLFPRPTAVSIQGEDKSWLDKHYKAEADAQWAKRQAVWDAEARARAALTAEAAAVQQLQMAERARARAHAQHEDDGAFEKFERERLAEEGKEAMRARARAEAVRREAEALKRQMEANAAAKAAARQEEFLAFKAAQAFEKSYDEKVRAILRQG